MVVKSYFIEKYVKVNEAVPKINRQEVLGVRAKQTLQFVGALLREDYNGVKGYEQRQRNEIYVIVNRVLCVTY